MRVTKIAKPMRGLHRIDDVVTEVGRAEGMDATQIEQLLSSARSAIVEGRLKSRNPETGILLDSGSVDCDISPIVAIKDVNDWLASEGVPYSAKESSGESAATPPETKDERQRRLLAWYEEEARIRERGALQRVFNRERELRPTADRGNIGKDIQNARKERKKKLSASQLIGPLGQR